MGFRFRKSFKLAPGIRMSVTPKGLGVSAGPRGAKLSVHSSGRVTTTASIPGSGLAFSQSVNSGSRSRRATGATVQQSAPRAGPNTAPPVAPRPPAPGMLAAKWEKRLWEVTVNRPDLPALPKVAALDPRAHQVAAFLETFYVLLPRDDLVPARQRLEWLWQEGYDPSVDPFLRKYLPHLTVPLNPTAEISCEVPPDRDVLGLTVAELRQASGELQLAIDCVESLTPSTLAAVSLAELYSLQGRWADVVDLTNGLQNEDELSTYLLIQRGVALREQRFFDASREAFKKALSIRSRPAALRHLALVERGQCYLAEGKRSMASKDFQKVLAENAAYPGLAAHQASVVL